jgi:hypothetical protein
MTVIQSPLAIGFKFRGVDYIARIMPTINDELVPVNSEMATDERVARLREQIETMANQVQGHTLAHGDIVAITAEGVQFANNLPALAGAKHAAGVWGNFVATLFEPEFHTKRDTTLQARPNGNAQISLMPNPYLSLQPEQKRAVFLRLYEKVYRECRGEKMDYTPEEEHCRIFYPQFLSLKSKPVLRWERMLLLAESMNPDSSLFLEDDEERELARRIATPFVPDPVVEDSDSSESLASSDASV